MTRPVGRMIGRRCSPPLAELAAIQGRATEARAAVAEGLRMAAGGPPDPGLAQLAATGLRVEADAAASARARRDEAAVEDARRRAGRIATEVERIAAVLGMPGSAAPVPREPSRIVALTALCRMEARRVEEVDDGAGWAAVAEAWEAIGRPYPVAYARYRQASAILRDRGARLDARAALGTARGDRDAAGGPAAARRDRPPGPPGPLRACGRWWPGRRLRRRSFGRRCDRPHRARARGPAPHRRPAGRTSRSPTPCSSAARRPASTPHTSSTSWAPRTGPRRARWPIGSGWRGTFRHRRVRPPAERSRRRLLGAVPELVEARVGDPEVVRDLVVDGVGDAVGERRAIT